MTLRSFLFRIVSRWEQSLDRAIGSGFGENDRAEAARGEFISTLIIDGGPAARAPDGRATSRRLGD